MYWVENNKGLPLKRSLRTFLSDVYIYLENNPRDYYKIINGHVLPNDNIEKLKVIVDKTYKKKKGDIIKVDKKRIISTLELMTDTNIYCDRGVFDFKHMYFLLF